MNLFQYVSQNGDKKFCEKKFNDIDNMVFSSLSYLDFSRVSLPATLLEVGKEYFKNDLFWKNKKMGCSRKEAISLLLLVMNQKRYKDIMVSDYEYKIDEEMQFSAVTFHLSKHLKYIGFEGTDEQVSGWKEDFRLAYLFPVPAHQAAIHYVNQHVSIFGSDVILGGHSKGGHLALVAGMYIQNWKQFKIRKIYSNDGPGLRKQEFESKKYQKVIKKYIHIVPEYSVVGTLFRNHYHKVVKSNKRNLHCHSMSTWQIDHDELVLSVLSTKSRKFRDSMIFWLDTHTKQEKDMIVNHCFQVLEDSHISKTIHLRNIKNMVKVLFRIQRMNPKAKQLTMDLCQSVGVF